MKKEMTVSIEDNYKELADDITNDELLSAIGGFVKILAVLCEKNNVDLQIDLYGSNNNNTTISYDFSYENAD